MGLSGKETYSHEKMTLASQQKLQIVLEGLSGQIETSKLCTKYRIAQTQYYQ